MNCVVCGKKIPNARLEALPHTKTCLEHSIETYRDDVKPDEIADEDQGKTDE